MTSTTTPPLWQRLLDQLHRRWQRLLGRRPPPPIVLTFTADATQFEAALAKAAKAAKALGVRDES